MMNRFLNKHTIWGCLLSKWYHFKYFIFIYFFDCLQIQHFFNFVFAITSFFPSFANLLLQINWIAFVDYKEILGNFLINLSIAHSLQSIQDVNIQKPLRTWMFFDLSHCNSSRSVIGIYLYSLDSQWRFCAIIKLKRIFFSSNSGKLNYVYRIKVLWWKIKL